MWRLALKKHKTPWNFQLAVQRGQGSSSQSRWSQDRGQTSRMHIGWKWYNAEQHFLVRSKTECLEHSDPFLLVLLLKKTCVEGGCLHNLSDQILIFSIESRAWCSQRTRCDTRSWYPRKLDMIWMSHSACLWCAPWMSRDLGKPSGAMPSFWGFPFWRGCLHPAAGQLWSTRLWMLRLKGCSGRQ